MSNYSNCPNCNTSTGSKEKPSQECVSCSQPKHNSEEDQFEDFMLSTLPDDPDGKKLKSALECADYIMKTNLTANVDFPEE